MRRTARVVITLAAMAGSVHAQPANQPFNVPNIGVLCRAFERAPDAPGCWRNKERFSGVGKTILEVGTLLCPGTIFAMTGRGPIDVAKFLNSMNLSCEGT